MGRLGETREEGEGGEGNERELSGVSSVLCQTRLDPAFSEPWNLAPEEMKRHTHLEAHRRDMTQPNATSNSRRRREEMRKTRKNKCLAVPRNTDRGRREGGFCGP